MKSLKFKSHLINHILDGTKTVTWRLFDDKSLQVGDELEFVNADTKESFAKATITEIREKELGKVDADDFVFSGYKEENETELLEHYRKIYGEKVNMDTVVKMIQFKLL